MKRSTKKMAMCIAMCMLITSLFSGCEKKKENVTLSVWGAEEDQEMLREMADAFKEKYKNEAEFNITISEENEVTCKETVLVDPKKAADIYAFADDQFATLCQNNTLLEITENVDEIIEENGGKESAAIKSASYDGKLYAYPMTASNGYFLYYNKEYFTEEDVKSLDKMLEIAKENGKKVAMDFTSGWYLYSFFKGAGLNVEISEDGLTNICDWNTTEGKYKGVDVAEAMCKIVSNTGFLNCGDADFVASPAIAALAAQSEYAHAQRVTDSFWMPVYVFGTTITAGNLDEKSLQVLLDQMVKDITALPEENK